MAEVLKQGMNIGFKCGTQANLEKYILGAGVNKTINGVAVTGAAAADGVFYLTTDTNRLYVGNNGKAVPVNQGIRTVTNTTELSQITGQPGEFYYVSNGNILAVYSNNQWIQINTDTGIDRLVNTIASAGTNAASIATRVYDSKGGEVSDAFDIAVENGLTLEIVEDNLTDAGAPEDKTPKIKIKGDTHTLTAAGDGTNKAKVTLGSTNGSASGNVTLAVTKNGTLTTDANNNISLEIKDTYLPSSDTAGAGAITVTEDATGFKVTVADSDGNDSFDRIDPQIKIGNAAAVPFVNGVATLDGYSKGEIDSKLQALNAMTYRGTVGASGSAGTGLTLDSNKYITAITGYKDDQNDAVYRVGDTFLLIEDFTFRASGDTAARKYEAGSLLIARGTETAGVITSNLSFDVVEESNNTDTTYKFTEVTEAAEGNYDAGYGIALTSIEGKPGQLVLKGKNVAGGLSVAVEKVSSTDSDGGVKEVISFAHDTVTKKDTTGAAKELVGGGKITVVTGVTRDNTGHTSGIETTEVTLGATGSSIAKDTVTTSVTSNVGTIAHEIVVNDAQGSEMSKTTTKFDIKSDTFTITDSDTTIGSGENAETQHGLKINMVWGSF